MSVTNYSYFRASYNSIIIIIKNDYKHPKDSWRYLFDFILVDLYSLTPRFSEAFIAHMKSIYPLFIFSRLFISKAP